MKRFILEIELGNAAMESPEHVAGELRDLADMLAEYTDWGALRYRFDEGLVALRDINGNRVGEARVEQDPPLIDCPVCGRWHADEPATDCRAFSMCDDGVARKEVMNHDG